MTFDEGLQALMAHGWRFQHLRNDAGHVVVLIGSYGWPEHYDRLHVHGETDAIAARALMDPRPGIDEVVWAYQGDAETTIQEVLALPKPHEPGAPRLSRRAPVGLWLPGTGRALPGPVVVPP
ncbi:MAG: hypothetical protein ACRDQ5_17290 [Sciscionella sp.]